MGVYDTSLLFATIWVSHGQTNKTQPPTVRRPRRRVQDVQQFFLLEANFECGNRASSNHYSILPRPLFDALSTSRAVGVSLDILRSYDLDRVHSMMHAHSIV